MLSLTCLAVSSSTMSFASRSDRASRVEFPHHERVTVSARGECFAETGSGAIRSGQSVVGEDVGGVDAESLKRDPLCGEVLFVCGHAGVSDQ